MVVQHLHTVPSESSTPSITTKFYASLAQLVELHPYTVAVGGSSPSGRTS